MRGRITVIGLDGSPLSAESGKPASGGGARGRGASGTWRCSASRASASAGLEGGPLGGAREDRSGPGAGGRARVRGPRFLRHRAFARGVVRARETCVSSRPLLGRAGLRAGRSLVGRRGHGKRPRPRPAPRLNVCRAHPKVAVLTSPRFGPAELARGARRAGTEPTSSPRSLASTTSGSSTATQLRLSGEEWEYPNVVLVLDERRVIRDEGLGLRWYRGSGPVGAARGRLRAPLRHDHQVRDPRLRALPTSVPVRGT